MPPGGDWTAATATESGCSSSSAYFGLISFDKAFEGYIKIPFKSLSNAAAAVAALDGENYFERIICTVKGLGGKYGNVVFGPFFVYRDCTSADGYAAAVAAVVDGTIRADAEVLGGLHRVNVGTQKQELPAVFGLLPFNHPLYRVAGVVMAGVFHAVGGDDEQRAVGHILRTG